MFLMFKLFAFAVVFVAATVFIAPAFTGSGSDEVAADVTQFKMDIPDRAPARSDEGITLNHIKQMASLDNQDVTSIDPSLLQELAAQNPEDVIQAIRAGGDGDVTEQTKRLITVAVGKARGIIEEDGFFVKPGHTQPKE